MTALEYSPDDLDLMARTVWGEARGEGFRGKLAVAWCIRNRVENPRWWGRTISGVCMKPQQFSCWNPDDPNASKCRVVTIEDAAFQACRAAAKAVLDGTEPDPAHGADHYCVAGLSPDWSKDQVPVAKIGNHVFYKLR